MGLLQSTIVLKAKDLTRALFDKAKKNIKATGDEAEKSSKDFDKLGKSVVKLSREEQKLILEQKKLENSTAKVALEQKKLNETTAALNRAYKDASTQEQKSAIRRKQLAADTKQLSLNSKTLSNEQKQLSISAKKAAAGQKSLEKNTRSLDGILKSTTSRILAFTATYLGLRKIKEGFLSILSTGGKFETMRVQLDGLMGSVEGGEAAFEWIKDFTKNTPLQLDGVTKAFVKMKALGLDPMDGTMQKLTDISSKLGGGQERLEGIILAVGQAWTKGKLQSEEANQLIERGVPVWDLMGNAIGKTTGELQDMARKGQLGRKEIKLLIDEIGKSSEGAAQAQMTTWAGIISNLGDTWTTFLSSIAKSGVLDYFKAQLTDLSNTIKEMAADGSLKEWAISISNSIVELSKTVKIVVSTIYEYKEAIVAMAVAQAGVKFAGFLASFLSVTTATKVATVATRGFSAALSINPLTIFAAALIGIGIAVNRVIESYKNAADLALAESELEASNEKIRQSILSRIEADKEAAIHAADYLARIEEVILKGNEQAIQQEYLTSEIGRTTEAAIALGAAQKGLADETGDTSKAIAKLADDELTNLISKIDIANESEIFVGGGWDDLRSDLLSEKLKRIGINLDEVTGKSTKAGRDGAQAFSEFSRSSDATAESVLRLADQLINAARTKGDIDLLKQSFEETGFEIERHPDLIQEIIDKNKEMDGSLDDIPKKWRDIAAAAKKASDETKSANNDSHSSAMSNIDGLSAREKSANNWRMQQRANYDSQRQKEHEKEMARIDAEDKKRSPIFQAHSEGTQAKADELDPAVLAKILDDINEAAASASRFSGGSYNSKQAYETAVNLAYQRQQKQQQQPSSTVNVKFISDDGREESLIAKNQESADTIMSILKTARSIL